MTAWRKNSSIYLNLPTPNPLRKGGGLTHKVRFWVSAKVVAKTKCKMKRNALTRKKKSAKAD